MPGTGISEATFYKWKAKYGGLEVSEARRLKRIVADLSVDNVVLKELLLKNSYLRANGRGRTR